jgi:hypothetical protein
VLLPAVIVREDGVATRPKSPGVPLPRSVKLQTVSEPTSPKAPVQFSIEVVACSDRKAKLLPIVSSVPPAGVTKAEYVCAAVFTTTRK